MKEFKMMKCSVCGKMIGFFKDSKVPTICCGKEMVEVKANSTEAAFEKHIPSIKVDNDLIHVEIGSVIHPMSEEHYIEFVILQTEKGFQRKDFKPGDSPIVDFKVIDDKPLKVYAYCNLHGLWVKEL